MSTRILALPVQTQLYARQLAACKPDVWPLLQSLPGANMAFALRELVAVDARWHVSHPINELAGPQAVLGQFYGPLPAAFPGLERRTDLFFTGLWTSPPEGEVGYSAPSVRGEEWWATATVH